MVTAGQLHRLARLLREVALAGTTDPGEPRPAPGLVAVTEDIARQSPARSTGHRTTAVSRRHDQVSAWDRADRAGVASAPGRRAGGRNRWDPATPRRTVDPCA